MKLTCNNPAFPDDHVFYINGLPPLPNGKAVEISDSDVATYEDRNGVKFVDSFKDNEVVKLSSAGKGGN